MDTISRENNSYLPVAGVIAGVLALVLSGVALAKTSSVKKELTDQVAPLSTQITEAEASSRDAKTAAAQATDRITKLANETNSAFTEVAQQLGTIRGEITKVQETRVAPAPKNGKDGKPAAGPAVAGPDEYVIKGGDTFAKIARAHGSTLADITAVNPGVDSAKLKVGQKIKLPAKK